jgi:hypothetical protein
MSVNIDYPALWRRVRPIPFQGTTVLGFDPEDLMLVLCVHGAKEQWARLLWLCDIAEFLKRQRALDWDVLFRRAAQQGCLRMVLLGLATANRLLEANLPPVAAERVAADRVAAKLAETVCRNLIRGESGAPSIYAVSRFRLDARELMRDQARYILRTITTPRDKHFALVKLPEWLFFGYPLVKLAHDYLALPVWMMAKHFRRRSPSARDRVSSESN